MVGKSFWGPFFDFLKDNMLKQELISDSDLELFHFADNCDQLESVLSQWEAHE